MRVSFSLLLGLCRVVTVTLRCSVCFLFLWGFLFYASGSDAVLVYFQGFYLFLLLVGLDSTVFWRLCLIRISSEKSHAESMVEATGSSLRLF